LLSELSIRDWSEGGAYAYNLIAGNIELRPQSRYTPYQVAHGTKMAGLKQTKCGDNRYFNNIFVGTEKDSRTSMSGLGIYKKAELPMTVDGNVYLDGAQRFKDETNQLELKYNPEIKVDEKEDGVYMTMNLNKQIFKMKNKTVDTELLGKAIIPDLRFENPDGTPLAIEEDYFGNKKSKKNPTPGPFEKPETGKIVLKVWDSNQ
jgi:hypothetical protein